MADPDSSLKQTIEYLRKLAGDKAATLTRDLTVINELEDKAGQKNRTTMADLLGSATVPSGASGAKRKGSSGETGPDTYLGMDALPAAKQYIRSVGHAVHIDEIADALDKGAAAVQGADWKDRLALSLVRSVYDVVKVKEGYFGLREFYTDEQLKSLRNVRGGAARDAKRKKKRGRRKVSESAKSGKREAPALLTGAVKE